MEKRPAISVIVPVYKAEKYLHRCVDSLLAQTFSDFEVLLVDDGSPDRSGEICDEYAKKDSRVKVFHKENGGVSSARNLGIDNALGDWICFVDSDDWLDMEAFACCSKYFNYAELIRFSYSSVYSMDCKEIIDYHLIQYDNRKEYVSKLIEQKSYVAVWGALFKKSTFVPDIYFDKDISIGEDWIFFIKVVNRCDKIVFVNLPLYKYNECNEYSSTTVFCSEKRCSVFLALKRIAEFVDSDIYLEELGNMKVLLLYNFLKDSFIYKKFIASLKIVCRYIEISFSEILFSKVNIRYKIPLLLVFPYMCIKLKSDVEG